MDDGCVRCIRLALGSEFVVLRLVPAAPLVKTPRVLPDLRDREPLLHVARQHGLDQVDAALAHDPRDAQFVVQDLVDAVEGVFLVHERVQEDAERPHVLLLAAVRLALEDLGRSVIYDRTG